jgi:hypothetical protein
MAETIDFHANLTNSGAATGRFGANFSPDLLHHTRSLMFLEGSLETENGEQIATVSSTARIVQLGD